MGTMLAKAIAAECNIPVMYVSASSVDSILRGSGADNVQKIFEAARKAAPVIVFMDEIDSVAGSRDSGMNQRCGGLNQLLVELDGFQNNSGIFFVASTNWIEEIDKALLRPGRLEKHIHVPCPTLKGRKELWDFYLDKVTLQEPINTENLASITTGLTGAAIKHIINEACLYALNENETSITEEHIRHALTREFMGYPSEYLLSDEEKRLIAFHESGHAIANIYSAYPSEIYQATILPRDKTLGFVHFLKGEQTTKEKLLSLLERAFGGRVAEELIFGEDNCTLGCASDFQKCTEIAEAMVLELGMSSLGFVGKYDDLGPDMQAKVDAEIEKILKESKQRTEQRLKKHMKELTLLAQTLIKEETISGKDLEKLLGLNQQSQSDVKAKKPLAQPANRNAKEKPAIDSPVSCASTSK